MQAHANYHSMYLLLKRLPFLQRAFFEESIHARLLCTPLTKYVEAGYSIGFENIGRIGIFVGFDKWKYHGIGITISIPFL